MKAGRMISTIDTHTGGNPTRTIIRGIPKLIGNTMAEKMLYMKEHVDWFRTALMFEPRGHDVMSGALLLEPCDPRADIGVIYIETGGYLPMCGHDTIGFCTALIEAGLVEVEEPETRLKLDTPAGLVEVSISVENGKATQVAFRNVPSFLYKSIEIDVEGIGHISCDIAYGGNFYGIVDAKQAGVELEMTNTSEIIDKAVKIRRAINERYEVVHPESPFIKGLTHIEFSGAPVHEEADVKNTVIVPPGGIDRSPCGTGTSAKLATLHAKGQLGIDEDFVHESIVGTLFRAKVLEETKVGDYNAVTNQIAGQAWVMGFHQFFLSEQDELRDGFLLIPPSENDEQKVR